MKKKQEHLVIGIGQIGTAIASIFQCDGIDKDQKADQKQYKYIHICFPYSDSFIDQVKQYQDEYSPEYTILHSTVKPGTSNLLDAVSSPVLGIHPHLEEGIRTFTKFLGGEKASEVADEFRRNGLKVYITDNSETTETMKILDTTFYGLCIEYTKEVKRVCKKNGLPFEMWTLWTNNYNEGYVKLGHPEYVRPNLVPIMKSIGGHCVLPNTNLMETPFTKFIKDLND